VEWWLDVLAAQIPAPALDPMGWIRDGGYIAVIGVLIVGLGMLTRRLADRERRVDALQDALLALQERRVTDARDTTKMLADALNGTGEHDAVLKRAVDELSFSNEVSRRGQRGAGG
jgi:hypothetical protein